MTILRLKSAYLRLEKSIQPRNRALSRLIKGVPRLIRGTSRLYGFGLKPIRVTSRLIEPAEGSKGVDVGFGLGFLRQYGGNVRLIYAIEPQRAAIHRGIVGDGAFGPAALRLSARSSRREVHPQPQIQ